MDINTVKVIVGSASSIGAGTVISNIVKATTPETVTMVGRISITIGTVVISGMIGEMAAKYATGEVDKIFTWVKSVNT